MQVDIIVDWNDMRRKSDICRPRIRVIKISSSLLSVVYIGEQFLDVVSMVGFCEKVVLFVCKDIANQSAKTDKLFEHRVHPFPVQHDAGRGSRKMILSDTYLNRCI